MLTFITVSYLSNLPIEITSRNRHSEFCRCFLGSSALMSTAWTRPSGITLCIHINQGIATVCLSSRRFGAWCVTTSSPQRGPVWLLIINSSDRMNDKLGTFFILSPSASRIFGVYRHPLFSNIAILSV